MSIYLDEIKRKSTNSGENCTFIRSAEKPDRSGRPVRFADVVEFGEEYGYILKQNPFAIIFVNLYCVISVYMNRSGDLDDR